MFEANGLSKRSAFVPAALACTLALSGIGWSILRGREQPAERLIELNERMSLLVPKGSKDVRIWIPVPADDAFQRAELLSLESPSPYRITQDKDFGNRLIYIEPKPVADDETIEIKALYRVLRKEQRGPAEKQAAEPGAATAVSDYLKPRGLETANDKIEKIAQEAMRGARGPMEKARAIYEYVYRHMRYDKSGAGWGRGDPAYACDAGKGNCTDFHSLFIALARAGGIPARFRMGIPLPDSSEGEPPGDYHCWAEFHVAGGGWVAVDISEAWKHPDKAEYFFGNLDANRVLISTGRDILLSPRQNGAPLNYLSRPYVEIDGRQVSDFKLERRFKDKRT